MSISIRSILHSVATALLLAACTAQSPSADTPQAPSSNHRRSAYIPGVTVVQVSEELAEELASGTLQTKSSAVNSELDRLGVISIERVFPDAGEWEPRHREAGLHRWFRIEFDPDAAPATKAAQDLSSVPGILTAEPERRIRRESYFNDPRASTQWALWNHGFPEGKYTEGIDVNVLNVWDNYGAGSPDVIVAVLDEGVQLNHPDLKASTIPAGPGGSQSFVYGRTGSNLPYGNHGTHVAGIIGATNNNNLGISSIAGGKDGKGGVRIMSCAILMDDPDDPEKTIGGYSANAFVWAADNGAVIANNSWSYAYETEEELFSGGIEESLAVAVNYFIRNAGCDNKGNQKPDSPMRGGLVLFAAGNEETTLGWPAAYEPVVAVGAIASNGSRAYYSNYGSWVDICAPGGDLKLGPGILSTITDEGYASYQGTSMACPQVAGVAALIVSHLGGPGFTCDMLKERLLNGASRKKAPGMIGPLVDALGSFAYRGKEAPDVPSGLSADVSANTVTLTWNVSPDKDDVKAYGYQMLLSTDRKALETYTPGGVPPGGFIAIDVEGGTAKPGETISGQFTGLEFMQEYYAAVAAYDYLGHYSSLSEVVTATTSGNNPPEIRPEVPGDYVLKTYQSLTYRFFVTDPDGHKVTIKFTDSATACRTSIMATYIDVTITGTAAPAGKYHANITATDKFGDSASYDFNYEILQNHTPVLVKNAENIIFDGTGGSVSLNIPEYIFDEDEEPLNYKITSSNEGVASVSSLGNVVTVNALGYGASSIHINASDISGSSCDLAFDVLVRNPSLPVEIFPNPVKNTLYLRPLESGKLEASVSNKAGATVYSGSAEVAPFEPMAIDMKELASGTYYVRLKGCGLDGRYTIVKI